MLSRPWLWSPRLELFIWLSDVPEDHGPSHMVPLPVTAGVSALPHGYLRSDITSGDNRSTGMPNGYKAGPGYDAVTGWGTPIGSKLQQLLS